MTSSDERLKVLKMIQEGKISPEEGAQLLDLLEENSPQAPSAAEPAPRGGRWFHVRVTDTDTGKPRANIRLPLGMVSAGLKLGMRFTPEIQGLDLDDLKQYIENGQVGALLDVHDNKDGERVEVSIE